MQGDLELAAARYEESPDVAATRCDDLAARLGASHLAFVRVHSIREPPMSWHPVHWYIVPGTPEGQRVGEST